MAAEREVCWHRIKVAGAREVVRRRVAAGWPPADCAVPRGWHVFCRDCLRVEPELWAKP
jgi:hypothetical protein